MSKKIGHPRRDRGEIHRAFVQFPSSTCQELDREGRPCRRGGGGGEKCGGVRIGAFSV